MIDNWVDGVNGWASKQGPGLTLKLTVILLIVGIVLICLSGLSKTIGEIGVGLLVGALFGFTSYTNQVSVQTSDFKSSLNLTQDLSGFDPQGHSMRGMSLADKNFRGAELKHADLRSANLKYSDFREAVLRNAHLNNAALFYATFLRADLTNAHLDGADLQGAKISTPDLQGATMSKASVTRNTCWNIPLAEPSSGLPTAQGERLVNQIVNGRLESKDGTLGRVCYKKEVGSSAQGAAPSQDNPIMICAEEPHLFFVECPDSQGD
jgi:hypothetical protein